jgi:co-chaperonin GroES (HSP10)
MNNTITFTPAPHLLAILLPNDEGEEKKLASGLFVPGTRTVDTVIKGKVIGIGRDVKSADEYRDRVVMVGRFAGTEVTLDEQKYLFVEDKYVLGIYHGDIL